MDEYLRGLYDYITKDRKDQLLRKTPEYRECREKYLKTRIAMQDEISLRHWSLVDDFLSAEAALTELEEEWLFQEGVALGKWLVRP